jgi:hypothetical protein
MSSSKRHLYRPISQDEGTGGLIRSINGGTTFTVLAGVSNCEAVGFGKSATVGGYPAVFLFGTVQGVTGVFQSDDQGATWTRVNDDGHEYGGLANGEFVQGDMNTFAERNPPIASGTIGSFGQPLQPDGATHISTALWSFYRNPSSQYVAEPRGVRFEGTMRGQRYPYPSGCAGIGVLEKIGYIFCHEIISHPNKQNTPSPCPFPQCQGYQ